MADDELGRITEPMRVLHRALRDNRNGLIATMASDPTIAPVLREDSERAVKHLDAAVREVEAACRALDIPLDS